MGAGQPSHFFLQLKTFHAHGAVGREFRFAVIENTRSHMDGQERTKLVQFSTKHPPRKNGGLLFPAVTDIKTVVFRGPSFHPPASSPHTIQLSGNGTVRFTNISNDPGFHGNLRTRPSNSRGHTLERGCDQEFLQALNNVLGSRRRAIHACLVH